MGGVGLEVTGFSVSKDGTVQVSTRKPMDTDAHTGEVLRPKKWGERR